MTTPRQNSKDALERYKEERRRGSQMTPFDLDHHGDEFIFLQDTQGEGFTAHVKIQTGIDEYRSVRAHFASQTQCERLLPVVLHCARPRK